MCEKTFPHSDIKHHLGRGPTATRSMAYPWTQAILRHVFTKDREILSRTRGFRHWRNAVFQKKISEEPFYSFFFSAKDMTVFPKQLR